MTQPSGESRSFTFDDLDVARVTDSVELVNGLVGDIANQNNREIALLVDDYISAGVLFSDPHFRVLAHQGLYDKQFDTIIKIEEAARQIPYEQLGHLLLGLSKRHDELVMVVAPYSQELNSYLEVLRREVQTVVRFAPQSEGYALALAENKYLARAEQVIGDMMTGSDVEMVPDLPAETLHGISEAKCELQEVEAHLSTVERLFSSSKEWRLPKVDNPEEDNPIATIRPATVSFTNLFNGLEPPITPLKVETPPDVPTFKEQKFEGGDLLPGDPRYEVASEPVNAEGPSRKVIDEELPFEEGEVEDETDATVEAGWPPEGFYNELPRQRLLQFVQHTVEGEGHGIVSTNGLLEALYPQPEQMEDKERTNRRGRLTTMLAPNGQDGNVLDTLRDLDIEVWSGNVKNTTSDYPRTKKVYQFCRKGSQPVSPEGYRGVDWTLIRRNLRQPKQ